MLRRPSAPTLFPYTTLFRSLTHSEPTHAVRVCCLVLGPHSSQRVHHTRTHTHRVDTNIDNLGRSPLQRTFLILTGHRPSQVMQLLSRRHRVHPPPSVLDPAQPPPPRSHRVGVITTPDHIHTADQITLGSDLLIIVDE